MQMIVLLCFHAQMAGDAEVPLSDLNRERGKECLNALIVITIMVLPCLKVTCVAYYQQQLLLCIVFEIELR